MPAAGGIQGRAQVVCRVFIATQYDPHVVVTGGRGLLQRSTIARRASTNLDSRRLRSWSSSELPQRDLTPNLRTFCPYVDAENMTTPFRTSKNLGRLELLCFPTTWGDPKFSMDW